MNTENNNIVSNGSSNGLSNDAALITDQSPDGIFSYDNRVPFWWKFLFVASVVFAPVYMLFFYSGIPGRSVYDQYGSHQATVMELRFKEIGDLTADRETILKFLNEKPEWLAVGKVTYQANCATCHGADGGGLVGPNLTDDYWKHVRSVEGIATVLENGAGNGAMPAWKTRFSHPNQIVLTAAYVASLRKKTVAGKGPEGAKVADWNE